MTLKNKRLALVNPSGVVLWTAETGLQAAAAPLFMGGGSCLIRHFVEYDPARVTINGDINATAKGYERLAEAALRKSRVIV